MSGTSEGPPMSGTSEEPPTSEGNEGVSGRGLFVTWLALMLLAGLSFGLRFAHLGALGMPAALAIAGVKAVTVALVFMELAFEKPSIRFAFAAGLVMIAVMLALMIGDVVTRAPPPLANPPGTQPREYGEVDRVPEEFVSLLTNLSAGPGIAAPERHGIRTENPVSRERAQRRGHQGDG